MRHLGNRILRNAVILMTGWSFASIDSHGQKSIVHEIHFENPRIFGSWRPFFIENRNDGESIKLLPIGYERIFPISGDSCGIVLIEGAGMTHFRLTTQPSLPVRRVSERVLIGDRDTFDVHRVPLPTVVSDGGHGSIRRIVDGVEFDTSGGDIRLKMTESAYYWDDGDSTTVLQSGFADNFQRQWPGNSYGWDPHHTPWEILGVGFIIFLIWWTNRNRRAKETP